MKTISLEEARKNATPGTLFATGNGALFCKEERNGLVGQVRIASDPHQPFGTTEERANAALLAHCWNTHDELVEALEKAIELASMEDGDYYKADDAGEVERVKAVLARAKTVDTP